MKFFVYGTLKVGGRFATRFDHLRRQSVKGVVEGMTLYNLGWYPGIKPGKGVVCGEVHEYDNEDEGHFEIVSMTGTVSIHGSHLHIAISDGDGVTVGGHLVSGCKIYTTAEIVILELDDVVYKRELFENDSGYEELVVYKK